MTFRRGTGSVEVELASVQTWIEGVEPTIEGHSVHLSALQTDMDSRNGSLRVIIWLNGIILGLVVLLVVALFSWGLNHITLKVESDPPSMSQQSSPQDAGNSRAFTEHAK